MANIYHANFHTESYRSSRPANAIRFGAASDVVAAAVAAELANWTVGRMTSLYAKTFFDRALPYPLGSRGTLNALIQDALGGTQRVRIRNAVIALDLPSVVALFTGVAHAGAPHGDIVALGAPPRVVGGGDVTLVIQGPVIEKS